VLENLPESCPKSQAAYTRAKNSETKRYIEIVERIKEKGLSFHEDIKWLIIIKVFRKAMV